MEVEDGRFYGFARLDVDERVVSVSFRCFDFGRVEVRGHCVGQVKETVRQLFDNGSDKDESCLLCFRCIVGTEKKVVKTFPCSEYTLLTSPFVT